jgi:ferredoxin
MGPGNRAGAARERPGRQRVFFREGAMRATVTDDCIACGLCVDTCPEVFEMGDSIAEVIVDEVPEEEEEAVRQAAEDCPTEAIILDE